MCTQLQLTQIMQQLILAINELSNNQLTDAILFGSYARHEADDESDIDVMLLFNLPREELVSYRRLLAQITGDLLLDYGVVVSPIMESKEFFERNRTSYPFFCNIDKEGIRYAA